MRAEWKGRDDGLVAHVFFKGGPNFALSVFAFAVEGYVLLWALSEQNADIMTKSKE